MGSLGLPKIFGKTGDILPESDRGTGDPMLLAEFVQEFVKGLGVCYMTVYNKNVFKAPFDKALANISVDGQMCIRDRLDGLWFRTYGGEGWVAAVCGAAPPPVKICWRPRLEKEK